MRRLSATAPAVALLAFFSASPASAQPLWVSVGPPGIHGVRITGLGADPMDSSTLYVGAANGVYRTTDRGLTWTMTSALGGLSSFAPDAASPGTVYALGQAVWKTTNGGTTWSVASGGIDFHSVFGWSTTALAPDPSSPATFYVGLAAASGVGYWGGVYKTANGGASWIQPSQAFGAAISALAVDPLLPSTIYAGSAFSPGEQGLFKTMDGGASWTKLGGFPFEIVPVSFVAVAPGSPSTVFVTVGDRSYRSRDGGVTWSTVSEFPLGAGLSSLISDPLSPSHLFAGTGVGVYRSIDGGDTWSPFNHGLNAGVTALALSNDSSTLYAGTQISGVFKLALDGNTGPCLPSPSALCLEATRFEVEVSWQNVAGSSGSGQALPITTNTGAFWFFSPDNLELVIKVLDGRSINGKFWVFYGALSNVEYTITVTDTQTGAVKTYFNPQGQLASVADTGAF